LHYKSFEELHGKQTTEEHRPSLKNIKTKTKGKTKTTTKTKYTMPFCPSAARAKNVGITVTCVECEKPHLLFSSKKFSKRDKTMLQGFLDTILYTCGTSFHNACDLKMAIPPKQPDIHDDLDDTDDKADDQNIEKGDDSNENENEQDEPEDSDNESEKSGNSTNEEIDDAETSINKLFSRVFVNDLWSCSSQVKKPYYSARIYPDVYIECGSLDVIRVAKDEHPHCSGCSGNTGASKKRLKWKQGGKGKGKQTRI
jgi:hypothetical protein